MCQYQVDAPLECVAIDIMGPLPTSASGNKYLLVDRLVTLFGVPRQFHTHQGANFEELAWTGMTNVSREEDARETIQKKRKYKNTDIEDKETERLKERKVQKVDTKEQKLEKIKAVLKDLSSQIGENLSVTLDKGVAETQEEQEIELHVSEGEV